MTRTIPHSSSITMPIKQSELEWIYKSVNDIFMTDITIGTGQDNMFANTITVAIDTSGSTNNINGRGRTSIDYKAVSGTDPIIVAEIKGVIYYLIELSNKYNLVGCVLQFYTFSDELKLANESKIDSIQSFITILQNLVYSLNYEFNSTNLMSFFQRISSDEYTQNLTHLVIATDGHPNVGGCPDDIIRFILSKPIFTKCSMVVIGAGSIQTSKGGSFGIMSNKGRFKIDGNTETVNLTELCKYIGTREGAGECNITFLLDIMNIIPSSLYLPSFGNYSKLRETAKNYLQQPVCRLFQYKIQLDNGNMIDLPDRVRQELDNGLVCLSYNFIVQKWYMYTPLWQLGVIPSSSELDKERIYIINNNDYRLSYKYDNSIYCQDVTPFMIKDSNIMLTPMVDHLKRWQCRRVYKM